MKLEKTAIIGGGIGGLALALALHRIGIPTDVYEQAPEISEVGAGIVVYPNTFKLLKRLGVNRDLLNARFHYERAEFSAPNGNLIFGMDLLPIAKEVGENCYPIHRAELLSAIADPIPNEYLRIDRECTDIEQSERSVIAHFSNGKTVETKCLVGADGINSVVRRSQIIDDDTRYSGQTCFRGVANLNHETPKILREVSGPGKRFGVCALSTDRMYWWAALNSKEAKMIPFDQRQDFLLNEFKGWAFQVEDCIKATPTGKILQNDLTDRKPIRSWSKGLVTLLGDAAHPTTPNLGQGANMALEDAIVLANCLHEGENLEGAYRNYETSRRVHSARVVRDSWRFGKLATWKNPVAVWAREVFARSTRGIALKRLRKIIDYDAGDLPPL